MKLHILKNPWGKSLTELQGWFFDHIQKPGMTKCPVCQRAGKEYGKHLNSGMILTLIWLHHNTTPTGEFIHLPTKAPRHVLSSNNVGALLYWDFVERMVNDDDPEKHHKGYYRITAEGRRFVLGHRTADATVYVYNNSETRRDRTQVTVQQALGTNKFNYKQLMNEGVSGGAA